MFIAAGVLALVAVVLMAYALGTRSPEPPDESAPALLAEPQAEPIDEGELPAPETQTDATEGREEAALVAAIQWKPEWSYFVDGHARDWREVMVYGGETEGEWEAILLFRWDGAKYRYIAQEPFPGAEQEKDKEPPKQKPPAKTSARGDERPLTEDDLKNIPREFRPGESTALEAALTGHEDWVGKVRSHSKDWSKAVVWIGPPQSEFVSELHLKWNRKQQYYDVVEEKGIAYP